MVIYELIELDAPHRDLDEIINCQIINKLSDNKSQKLNYFKPLLEMYLF
jgi:hypothetical protein